MTKKTRIKVMAGTGAGVFALLLGVGAMNSSATTERFMMHKGQIISDLEASLHEGDISKSKAIIDEYGIVDDYDLKLLIAKYSEIKNEVEQSEKQAIEQARIESMTARLNQPFKHKVLEVVVKRVQIMNSVGSAIFNESAQSGVKYLAVDYSYKNISKSPTREEPELVVVSPDGAQYSPDISASALYAGNSDEYDEELFSELNPQVHSNGAEVFKVPESIQNQTGWRLKVSFEEGAFTSGKTVYLNLN